MKNFFVAAEQMNEFVNGNKEVYGSTIDFEGVSLNVSNDYFKEMVDDYSETYLVDEEEIEDVTFAYRLRVKIKGVEFKTYVQEVDYQIDFDSWLHDEPYEFTDEEFYNNGVSEQDRAMKECGHKLHDFT